MDVIALCLFAATMENPLTAHELFHQHLLPLMSSCLFIGVFVITVPVVYLMGLSPDTELVLFTLLVLRVSESR